MMRKMKRLYQLREKNHHLNVLINRMSNPPTLENKKQFLEELKVLTKDEYGEIFRIIKNNNVEYSENSNGIFFDLNVVDDEVFLKLTKFMELCLATRNDEAVRTKEIDTLRQESDLLTDA